jgi:sugar fermentation stimulation protein A
MGILQQGARAVLVFFINRCDCDCFAPGDSADPIYGQLLRQAISQGLEVLPCRFEVTLIGINYLGLAKRFENYCPLPLRGKSPTQLDR